MTTIKIKQHDTKVLFTDTPLIDGVEVPVADMTGCTVSFVMTGGDDVAIKEDASLVLTGTVAKFEYQPVADDVSETGVFKQEWEVVYPSGKILTFPNNGYNSVRILSDLG
jgi:hypothetical protein